MTFAGLKPPLQSDDSPPCQMPNETILEEAQRLVYGDRRDSYGHPYDDYACTGEMFEAILRRLPGVVIPRGTIRPDVACLMMVAGKVSRQVHKPKRDGNVDIAGYAACAQLCAEREAGEGENT